MIRHYLELHETGQFPKLLLDYLSQNPALAPFYSEYPSLENVRHVIERRSQFPLKKREQLVAALEKQYKDLPGQPDFSLLLKPTTFTVTTGHQLNIFAGPLYIIYKIITTINLARLLKITYPDYDFVPVYWMASEDHDFEEIASVHLFGKTYRWSGAHSGAVGRLNPRELSQILDQLPEPLPLFQRAYLQHTTLSDAVRHYMHDLFGNAGLISLDADDPELKKLFAPVITDELLRHSAAGIVQQTTTRLQKMGYHTPVYARDINLFYLSGNLRERIEKRKNEFHILRTANTWNEEKMLEEVTQHPERFSPNVVLRPLYQETILPNLAYIGGPSEIPYWMQLKGVFDHFQESFPLLIPRNFALFVTAAERRRLGKLGFSYQDLFGNKEQLRKELIARHSKNELYLTEEKQAFDSVFGAIFTKASAIDKTMEAAVLAERTRLLNSLNKLEKRLQKAEERNHAQVLQQLQTVLDSFFPEGVPQERYHNFLDFHLKNSHFIPELFRCFDPFDFRFHILEEM